MSASDAPLPRRRPQKSPSAFRTISEVAGELDLPQHVLRFWETKFSQVRPLKRGGGRRYYRPEDIRLLRCIRELLYRDGYTIKGVQRLLRETGVKALIAGVSPVPNADATEAGAGAEPPPAGPPAPTAGLAPQTRAVIEEVLADLVEIRRLLRGEKGPPG